MVRRVAPLPVSPGKCRYSSQLQLWAELSTQFSTVRQTDAPRLCLTVALLVILHTRALGRLTWRQTAKQVNLQVVLADMSQQLLQCYFV